MLAHSQEHCFLMFFRRMAAIGNRSLQIPPAEMTVLLVRNVTNVPFRD